MKGLIIKDLYCLKKEIRLFLDFSEGNAVPKSALCFLSAFAGGCIGCGVIPQENKNYSTNDNRNNCRQKVCLPITKGLAVIDDRCDDLGSDRTANAVGRHDDTGVTTHVLMEPPANDGTGHGASHHHDAHAPKGAADV
mgnify:CR=1 FL=1